MSTAPHVGARMEAVAPRPVTDRSERFYLSTLLLVAVAVHAWIIANTYVTAKDSIGFAQYALQLQDPSKSRPADAGLPPATVADVLRSQNHPPGFPVLILLVSMVVRPLTDATVQDQILLSAQIASAIAGVLTVFPCYWIGRALYGKFAGFAAAILYQVLPVAAHETSDGLTEGPYILMLATSLALGVRAAKKPSIGRFLLCGLAIGLTYLIRPEGLIVALTVGLVALGMAALRRWPRRSSAAWLVALTVGVTTPAAPYMILIGGVTNKPTGAAVIGTVIGNPREKIMNGEQGMAPKPGPLFAGWYIPERDGSKAGWLVRVTVNETLKGLHYGAAVFALGGIVISLRRLRGEPWLSVPLLTGALNLALVLTLGVVKYYVSERHCLPMVYIGCIFAGGALAELPRLGTRQFGEASFWAGWATPVVLLLVLVVSCLPSALKQQHQTRFAHKKAGLFLANNVLQPQDSLIDPNEWAGFYSGRMVYRVVPNDTTSRVTYAVVEPSELNEIGHTPKPQMEGARNVANDGRSEIVYWWPEELPKEEAKAKARLLVYRLENK